MHFEEKDFNSVTAGKQVLNYYISSQMWFVNAHVIEKRDDINISQLTTHWSERESAHEKGL